MVDLTKQICHFGTASSRGMEAVEILQRSGERIGRFEQNGVEIIVFPDSTEREIAWQYQSKIHLMK